MLYAFDLHGKKIEASPKIKGFCPICETKVKSKCGKINVWHFSHENKKDCDTWSEGETQWHKDWKNCFRKDEQEAKLGEHRADVLIGDLVIELQNSSINPDEIKEREEYYGSMIWIFNETKKNNVELIKKRTDLIKGEIKVTYYTNNFCRFRWKHPRKSTWFCNKKIYLDIGNNELLRIESLQHKTPCYGTGYIITKIDFILDMTRERW